MSVTDLAAGDCKLRRAGGCLRSRVEAGIGKELRLFRLIQVKSSQVQPT